MGEEMNFWVSECRKTLEECTITPDVARKMLVGNVRNRNKKNLRVKMYADDMRRGRWRLTGDTIRFSKDGTLLDGQNRLMACIEAGVPFVTDVKVGLEQEVMRSVDRNSPRSFADDLKIAGYKNSSNLASIVGGLYRYDKSGSARFIPSKQAASYPMTSDDGFETLERHNGAEGAASYYSTKTRARVAPASIMGICLVICSEIDKEDAEYFFGRLSDKVGLDDGSPILALINACERVDRMVGQTGSKDMSTAKLPLIIKAWNAYLRGDFVMRLKFNWGGRNAEKFPEFEKPRLF